MTSDSFWFYFRVSLKTRAAAFSTSWSLSDSVCCLRWCGKNTVLQ